MGYCFDRPSSRQSYETYIYCVISPGWKHMRVPIRTDIQGTLCTAVLACLLACLLEITTESYIYHQQRIVLYAIIYDRTRTITKDFPLEIRGVLIEAAFLQLFFQHG